MIAAQATPSPVPLTSTEHQLLAMVSQLIARIDDLQAKVAELAAWTAEIGDDLLDCTGAPADEVA